MELYFANPKAEGKFSVPITTQELNLNHIQEGSSIDPTIRVFFNQNKLDYAISKLNFNLTYLEIDLSSSYNSYL